MASVVFPINYDDPPEIHFTFFGAIWTLELVRTIPGEKSGWTKRGECDATNNRIRIATETPDGWKLNPAEMRRNIVHELIHVILGDGQYDTENDNEPMIEWLAKGLIGIGATFGIIEQFDELLGIRKSKEEPRDGD